MSLLRDDVEVALTELEVALRASAEDYREAAGLAGNRSLAELFEGIAARREEVARRADAQLQRLERLPEVPDPERRLLARLAERVRLALSPHADRRLVEARRAADGDLQERVSALADGDLPPASAALVRVLEEELAATRDTLAHVAAQPPV